MKIEAEILRLTGEKSIQPKEKRQAYLKRLVKAAEGVPEKAFDTLSKAGQEWANAGIRADDKSKPIEDFADDGESETETPETEGSEDTEKETTVVEKTAAKAPAAKPAAKEKTETKPKETKAAAPAKEAKKRGNGKVEAVLGVILKNPTKKTNDLVELLKAKDIEATASTVSTVRSDFIRACNFLAAKGLLEKNPFA